MTAKAVKGSVASAAGGSVAMAVVRDLLVLAKARVVSLLVFTGAVGAVLAPGFSQHLLGAGAGLLGIALAGGAGGVINQLIEPSLDQHMRRTRQRPLAVGRISRPRAVMFAAALFTASVFGQRVLPIPFWDSRCASIPDRALPTFGTTDAFHRSFDGQPR